MTSDKKVQQEDVVSTPEHRSIARESDPEWTDGLRQLYVSVVEEPIPDSFKDLLAKLDYDDEEGD